MAKGLSATDIALKQKPIELEVWPDNNHIGLNDGRHRLLIARKYGAEKIRALVRVYGRRGGVLLRRELILTLV